MMSSLFAPKSPKAITTKRRTFGGGSATTKLIPKHNKHKVHVSCNEATNIITHHKKKRKAKPRSTRVIRKDRLLSAYCLSASQSIYAKVSSDVFVLICSYFNMPLDYPKYITYRRT